MGQLDSPSAFPAQLAELWAGDAARLTSWDAAGGLRARGAGDTPGFTPEEPATLAGAAAESSALPGLRAVAPARAGRARGAGCSRLPPPRPAAPATGPGAAGPAHKITTVRTAAAAASGELLGRRAFAKRNSPNPRRGRTPIAEVRRLRGRAAGIPAGKPGQGPTCALPHSQIRGTGGVPVLTS